MKTCEKYVALIANLMTLPVIRSRFCTCHDSSAVVTCAKSWPDWIIITHPSSKHISCKIWIMSLWCLGETSLWSQCLYQSESYLILVLAWYRLHCQNSQTAGDIWTVCCHDDTIPWELFHHKWLSVTKLVFQDNWYRNAFCHKMAIIFTFWHANSGIKLWILSCITFDTYNYTRWPGNHGSQAISKTFLTLFIAKICINSSPLSATYMCQWIWSSLVQIMACCLFAKPLTYRNKLQWNSDIKKKKHFIHKNVCEILCTKWRPFCPEKMSLGIKLKHVCLVL